jgi:hypothetical protein
MWKVLTRVAVVVMLAASIVFPGAICSQELPPARTVTERKEVPVLDVKPGCWQLRVHVSSSSGVKPQSVEEIRKEWMDRMTPEQRKSYTPEVWNQMFEGIREGQIKSAEQMGKGSDALNAQCPLTSALMNGLETTSFGDAQCNRSIHANGQVLHMETTCPGRGGKGDGKYVADFQLVNAQTFKGAIRSTPDVSNPATETTEFTGKWISEAAPHMPSGVTDIYGRRPLGPQAVAGLDPYRIVAIMDGKQIVAGFAWAWMSRVPPSEGNGYQDRLPELLQQLYSQLVIADEAVKLGLTLEEPWRSQLKKLGHNAGHAFDAVTNYPGDPNVPPSLVAQWDDARKHIFWSAYLSQASTDEGKQALLRKIKERFKIKVVDPDFFNGQKSP